MKRYIIIIAAMLSGMQFVSAQPPQEPGQDNDYKERIERRVNIMKERLSLTDSQAKDLTDAYIRQHEEREKAMEEQREKMEKINTNFEKKLSGILTQEQIAELEKMTPPRPGMEGRRGPGIGMEDRRGPEAGPGPRGPKHEKWHKHPRARRHRCCNDCPLQEN